MRLEFSLSSTSPANCAVEDDPELWKTQPMALQIVGRPYRDEALIATCELLDKIINVESP